MCSNSHDVSVGQTGVVPGQGSWMIEVPLCPIEASQSSPITSGPSYSQTLCNQWGCFTSTISKPVPG